MLRIVTQQDADTWTLSLHGRLAESWVELLDRQWRALLEAVPAGRVRVLLSDVSFIDGEGQRLLERMSRRGTGLEASSGCMNRYLIARIRARTGTTEDVPAQNEHDLPPTGGTSS
jgi:hypothetical protein